MEAQPSGVSVTSSSPGVGASKRQTSLPNSVWLPSYVRFDAALYYATRAWTLQLNVKNVTDERIYDLTGTTMMPQSPRRWLVSAAYKF